MHSDATRISIAHICHAPALRSSSSRRFSGLGYGLAAVLGLGLLDPAALATKAAYLLALG